MTVTLGSANRIYAFARTVTVTYHPLDCAPFRQFCIGLPRFLRACADASGEEFWGDLIRTLKRFRFRVATNPIPLDHPALEPAIDKRHLQILVERGEVSYPHVASEARVLLELWSLLRVQNENPILQYLSRLTTTARDVALVLPDTRLLRVSGEILRAGGLKHVEVRAPADLRGNVCHDLLIPIGSTRWFPDYVFNSPRAPEIAVVGYKWFMRRWRPRVVFFRPHGASESVEPFSEPEPDIELETPLPDIDWKEIERRAGAALGSQAGTESQEKLEGILFTLHGGYAVFLEAQEGSTCLVIDLSEAVESRVMRIETRAVQPGMYILLRTEGGGDYILPVANRILQERATTYRTAQHAWKAKVRELADRQGLLRLSSRLRDLGARHADENNIRHWMSERSIATQEDHDFLALMSLIGMDSKTSDRYLEMMRAIRAAHLRAGMAIRRRLLEQVKKADAEHLASQGRIDFVLPEAEGGKLSGFRVEARAPTTYLVPTSRLNHVFLRGD